MARRAVEYFMQDADFIDDASQHEYYAAFSRIARFRGIAQSGSAPALGAGCREFESLYPDHFFACTG